MILRNITSYGLLVLGEGNHHVENCNFINVGQKQAAWWKPWTWRVYGKYDVPLIEDPNGNTPDAVRSA